MNRLRHLSLLVLPVAALLLAGCFNIESDIVVEDDGAATQTVRIILPQELLTGFGGEEVPSVDEMREEFEADPSTAEMREALEETGGSFSFFESEDGGVGIEISMAVEASDNPGEALAARAEEFAEAAPDDEDTTAMFGMGMPNDTMTLRKEGDGWLFELEQAEFDSESFGDLAGDPEMAGMAGMFLGQIEITTSVKLPGEVTEHNADEVEEDGTLVWRQTAAESGQTLQAATEIDEGGAGTWIAIAVMAAGLALVGVALAYIFLQHFRGAAR